MRYQSWAVVSGQVFITDGDEAPEGLLRRHVHEEDGGQRGLGLTVAVRWVVHCVRLQDVEQVLLPATSTINVMNMCTCRVKMVVICVLYNKMFGKIKEKTHHPRTSTRLAPDKQQAPHKWHNKLGNMTTISRAASVVEGKAYCHFSVTVVKLGYLWFT